jgi:hypothetical protein
MGITEVLARCILQNKPFKSVEKIRGDTTLALRQTLACLLLCPAVDEMDTTGLRPLLSVTYCSIST